MELIDKAEVLAAIENAAKSNPLYVTIAEKDAFKDGVNDALESVLKLEIKAKVSESEPTHFATSETNDLAKAAINAADEDMQGRQIMEASNDDRQRYSRIFRRGFKAGANWQEQQINKNAIYGIVAGRVKDEVFVASRWFKDDKLKPAEDIKLIIIKK